jgi:hypothetical protein
MGSSFRWVEVRHRPDGLLYGPYFRAKRVAAQFKEPQKEKAEILQNFYFYPGGRRDKINRILKPPKTKHENHSR